MKILCILLCILVVSECSRTVTQQNLQMAETYCKDKGGVFSLMAPNTFLVTTVTCKNGESSNTNEINK